MYSVFPGCYCLTISCILQHVSLKFTQFRVNMDRLGVTLNADYFSESVGYSL